MAKKRCGDCIFFKENACEGVTEDTNPEEIGCGDFMPAEGNVGDDEINMELDGVEEETMDEMDETPTPEDLEEEEVPEPEPEPKPKPKRGRPKKNQATSKGKGKQKKTVTKKEEETVAKQEKATKPKPKKEVKEEKTSSKPKYDPEEVSEEETKAVKAEPSTTPVNDILGGDPVEAYINMLIYALEREVEDFKVTFKTKGGTKYTLQVKKEE